MSTDTLTPIDALSAIVGAAHVLTGDATDSHARDWAGEHQGTPLAVVRPGSTKEVSEVLKWANRTGTAIVPRGGGTGLTGATAAGGAVLLSMERMRAIREIRPEARVAVVEAGAILSTIHDAVAEHDLIFPLFFGARGSAMLGGALSTNAGGSNVLRYGNTRDLCLGIEAVLPDGQIVNLMSQLHKDNSGYNLRQLLVGAEGTLGVITAAVLRLYPRPRAYATAMVAARDVSAALRLLNRLKTESGGAVEAFEYMPGSYVAAHMARFPEARAPFDAPHDVNILIELGATAPRDAIPAEDGTLPIATLLETALADAFEAGEILDAVVAQSDSQRMEMWARREASAEVCLLREPLVHNDVAVPLDRMQELLDEIAAIIARLDPGAQDISVAHLGDGNLHFAVWPENPDPALHHTIHMAVEEAVVALGGSFSAEHGIGTEKLPEMQAFKDPAALAAMRAIKQALDPKGILNPGKLIPAG
ncbi:FAD-binding oxidoreductase [Roseovarius nubinhibens]|uniref:FAD dependent oxidoreductase n=1 Tax=Roseovarius nubinhibens (strain ATCC BAA-591 / DSM 15170 / ISM) TaxID=89187 RepID=A3SRQ2_ROSNI|nr:FAD-binding oxidoreductase [Roseovarius nubinhibens]EAP75275.1 FAD dependent oxidoreductase [Roseovarius nubinhibens ISM]